MRIPFIGMDATQVATLAPGDYTMRSEGMLGGMHTLVAHSGPGWLKDRSLLGSARGLNKSGGTITVIQVQLYFLEFKLGKPWFIVSQEGHGTETMLYGTTDDIIEVVSSR